MLWFIQIIIDISPDTVGQDFFLIKVSDTTAGGPVQGFYPALSGISECIQMKYEEKSLTIGYFR